MSRIGKLPVEIPGAVEVKIEGKTITVKGPKGELKTSFEGNLDLSQEENKIIITRKDEEKKTRALHGLTRSLIQNMVTGVSEGFEKKLEIQGVGYRAEATGKAITLNLGFSHPVKMDAPDEISVELDQEAKNIIIVKGIDKQKVGQFAAEIREWRKPEPYKGKGIRYVGEYVARKAGKKAAK